MNTDRFKFRGLTINGEWCYGNLTIFPMDNKTYKAKKGDCFISNRAGCPLAYRVRPETVGQCTGRKINGTLLYEKDIIQIGEYRRIVAYSINLGRFVTYFNEDISRLHSIYKGDFEDFIQSEHKGFIDTYLNNKDFKSKLEIIGNIYEDKELLINKEQI